MGEGRGPRGTAERYVVVDGWGGVADEVTAQLRRLGVRVRAGGHAADAAELAVAGGGASPGVLVLVDDGRPGWLRAPSMLAPWHVHGVPHLPVRRHSRSLSVGPLVVPGRSACLGCVSARTGERPEHGPAPGDLEPVDDGVLVMATSVATVTTLSALRGDPSLAGLSTEITAHGGGVRHRVWTSRPGCGCASVRMVG